MTMDSLTCEFGQTLYENTTIRVSRGRLGCGGETVVFKLLKPEAATESLRARFRAEYELLSSVAIPGVIKTFGLEEYQGGLLLALEDIDGADLERLFEERTQLDLRRFLDLASGLAETLAALHRDGIVHKGINPAHIVYNFESGRFRLIGFGLAEKLAQRFVMVQPATALEGRLSYLAPEQTGRMNRQVDYRSDFYSLGATFYHLLTGKPPFTADDALGMVHCQIAATPKAPYDIDPAIPLVVSRMVMKLMAKMAEDRYQSGLGLKADLDRCMHMLDETGSIADFEPGMHDLPDRLRIPQKLYGREREIEQLLAAYEGVRAGRSKLLLVTGYDGVGKTALVHEAFRPALTQRGYFIEGKFDSLQRSVPYCGFAQALSGFVNYLLMESEAELAEWRGRIQQAVGSSGRVLTEVIPNLELIIGSQPPVPVLGGSDAQSRLNYLFLELVRVIAQSGHPLVVFLDDLQWIDVASLDLVQTLLRSGVGHVLVIGAYRANEVDALHPLTQALDSLRKELGEISQISLENLSPQTVNEMIADALRCGPDQATALSRTVHAKTYGNPFFTIQLFETLDAERIITYDDAKRQWQWDDATIADVELAENVVSLMVARIARLPPGTREVLPQAACLGYRFDLREMNAITRQPQASIREQLQPALTLGLIIPFGQKYHFAHDRVRQAAYSLIPESERKQVHLEVGRLLRQLADDDREKQSFNIVDHLNEGADLIDEDVEKSELAQMNLQAGIRAKASAAYAAAAHYMEQALRLQPQDAWHSDYRLVLALHKDGAESEYLAGNYQRADALIDSALKHTTSAVDKAAIYTIQVVIYTLLNRYDDAIAIGLHALALLGLELPDPNDAAALRDALSYEQGRYAENARKIELQTLRDAPAMDDAADLACMQILIHLSLAAYYRNYNLFSLLTMRTVNLSLTRGIADSSALAFVLMAMVSIARNRDYDTAEKLGGWGMALADQREVPELEGKLLMYYANCVDPWFHTLKEGMEIQKRGFQAAVDAGGLNDAVNCLWGEFRNMVFGSSPLDETLKQCQITIDFAQKIHDQAFAFGILFFKQIVHCFQYGLDDSATLSSIEFDEREFLAMVEAMNWQSSNAHYHVFKTWLLFAYDHVDEALPLAEATAPLIDSIADQPHVALHFIHHSLLLARRYTEFAADKQAAALVAIRRNQERLMLWSQHCPQTFLHYHLLGEAELARLESRELDAMRLYDDAIASAERNGALYICGVACECAARFWFSRDKADFAELYLQQAHRAYSHWQARGKVKALERAHPKYFASGSAGHQAPERESLDIGSLMKATRVVSREMELQRLLGTVVHIVIESAGAQKGYMLLKQGEDWVIAAKGEIGVDEVELPYSTATDRDTGISPGVVRFVERTMKPVVIDDASADASDFPKDEYLLVTQPKSVLCMPIQHMEKLLGLIYLENNLVAGAFTPTRRAILEALLSQVAISLENARTYKALHESEERFRLVYENSPVPTWEEDFSVVKARLDKLREIHGGNLESHLIEHPDIVRECAALVRVINVNNAALELHEADTKAQLHEGLPKTFIAESYDAFRKELIALAQGRTELAFDSVVQTLKGRRREVSVSFSVCPGYEQNLDKVLVSLFDITQRKQDEEGLRLAASVFSTSQEGILISDADNRIIDINPAFSRLTGYSREEALGRNPSFLSSGRQSPDFYAEMWRSLDTTGEWQGELWNRRKSGELYPELLSIVAVMDKNGRLQHYVGVFSDISMIKQHEADLDRIAHYDMLTSVPNRRLLDDRLAQAIAYARRHNRNLAVCYLDLDGFKPINDRLGHEGGDRMLIEVAKRLQSMSRGEDTVARLGGDEFVMLWNDIGTESDCHRALERILKKVSEPMLLDDETVSVSASIGVTLFPEDNVDADSLLRHADHAMYIAKQLGKNRYQIFDARLEEQISAQAELLAKVAWALERNQFELYYQPKVDYTTGDVVGAEALLRWNDPLVGLVGPSEFLPLIENDMLAFRMGRWVIEEAVRQARRWHDLGITMPISINIFPRHLKSSGFIDDLRYAIENHWPQMPKHRLLMEVVETTDLEELDPIQSVISDCLEMGIGFSLDDFGTGYSSLVYLRRLSIEELKIDQSFVRDMLIDPDDEAIVVGVIHLCKAFGLRVVAEGVETTEQAEHLVALGCPIIQGYGLGRPMHVKAFEEWHANFKVNWKTICRR